MLGEALSKMFGSGTSLDKMVASMGEFQSSLPSLAGGPDVKLPPVTLQIKVENAFTLEKGSVTPIEIRDILIPQLTNILETGVRGVRERWAQIIAKTIAGITSSKSAVTGAATA
jgi:hypothetical protein